MLLNAVESGSGERIMLLLHGMMGSAESWWRVASALSASECRVIALDLPGHGDSPRDASSTIESAADAVVETLWRMTGGRPISAIGHSYGGTVLAAAAARLPIDLAVYVDTSCSFIGGADREQLTAQYAADRARRRDAVWLRTTRPYYSEQDALVEARAAEKFDPATAASISSGADVSYPPGSGSILVRAEPSSFVTDDDARSLSGRGVDVRSIPGAAHTVWYSHCDEFVAALPEVFNDDGPIRPISS
ncbi:alpha/beta fold hydrolase [Microbacterium sp.]|uniref:alpha/beta fold hydrolase n=1 Tax=Microbacterium sp. TaxID=51671 RepID=UPI003F9E27D7